MNNLAKFRKIFIILGFIVFILVIGYFLYRLFFRSGEEPIVIKEPTAGTTTPGGKLPTSPTGQGQIVSGKNEGENLPTNKTETIDTVARGGITKVEELSQVRGSNISLGKNGTDLQFYSQGDGKFYRLTPDGKINALSLNDKVFYEAENVVWSPKKNEAIIEYPDGAKIMYNFDNNTQTTLPKYWKDFSFSPDGNQIVAKSMGNDASNRWLAVANEDGSKARRVAQLGENDSNVIADWSPNNQMVAMYTESAGFDKQEVYFVGLNNENYKSTVVDGRGFEPKWSPKGDKLLYSVYSSQTNLKPSLWIVNAQGDNIGANKKQLNLETWVDKCAFSGNTEAYCAVPETLPEGSGPMKELAVNTRDNLYKIDLNTGLKKLIAIPDGDYSISSPIVSDNGYYLYFTDNKTGKINKINLK